MRVMRLVLLMMLLSGCEPRANMQARSETDALMFGPAGMRVHPIFTRVRDWSGDGRADGIEALVELQDQFGDPIKASGRVLFELYTFRPYSPDPRGTRLARWIGEIETLEQQRERWNRTSRTYSFPLEYARINPGDNYVLTAQFELSDGGRFFDRMVLEARLGAQQPAEASGAQRVGQSIPSERVEEPQEAP
jgi:hypothetical protein